MNVKIRKIFNNGITDPEPKGADYATLNPHQPPFCVGWLDFQIGRTDLWMANADCWVKRGYFGFKDQTLTSPLDVVRFYVVRSALQMVKKVQST